MTLKEKISENEERYNQIKFILEEGKKMIETIERLDNDYIVYRIEDPLNQIEQKIIEKTENLTKEKSKKSKKKKKCLIM